MPPPHHGRPPGQTSCRGRQSIGRGPLLDPRDIRHCHRIGSGLVSSAKAAQARHAKPEPYTAQYTRPAGFRGPDSWRRHSFRLVRANWMPDRSRTPSAASTLLRGMAHAARFLGSVRKIHHPAIAAPAIVHVRRGPGNSPDSQASTPSRRRRYRPCAKTSHEKSSCDRPPGSVRFWPGLPWSPSVRLRLRLRRAARNHLPRWNGRGQSRRGAICWCRGLRITALSIL